MFAQNKNYFVTNEEDFAPFVQAVVNNLTNKAMIKIIMDDPNKSAKDSEEVCELTWAVFCWYLG
jgi:hypothetical protein